MQTSIVLGDTDIHEARVFAEKSVSTHISHYALRHQTDPKQIQHQIEIGKRAELGVFHWFRNHDVITDVPDLTVYDTRHKSFAPDFMVEGLPVHVKSQDQQSAERFGLSWTFQYSASSGSDKEIFAPEPKGFVVFTLVDENIVTIKATPTVAALHSFDLFRDPQLKKLRGIKTVVYYDDLKQLQNHMLWALIVSKFKNVIPELNSLGINT